MDLTGWAIEQFLRFVLVTGRMSGLFLMAPFFGEGGLPERMKVALAAVTALVLVPVLPVGDPPVAVTSMGLGSYVVALVGELAVGAAIGLAVAVVLVGLELAGLFVGQQTGLAFANVVDPIGGDQVSVMGQFNRFLALVVFLAIGGHRMLLMAMARSFETAPLGRVWAMFGSAGESAGPGAVAAALVGLSARMFTIALGVAAPVIVTLVLVTVALGLVARTVPQMNILVVGFPVRILLGWGIVLLGLGATVVLTRDAFFRLFEDLMDLVGAL
jgi:flagellar biosynthetic protein FliR